MAKLSKEAAAARRIKFQETMAAKRAARQVEAKRAVEATGLGPAARRMNGVSADVKLALIAAILEL